MIHYIATRAARLADRAVSNRHAIDNARQGLWEARARRREPPEVLAAIRQPAPGQPAQRRELTLSSRSPRRPG